MKLHPDACDGFSCGAADNRRVGCRPWHGFGTLTQIYEIFECYRNMGLLPGMQINRRTLMVTLGGRLTLTVEGGQGENDQIKTEQHEGNKGLSAGYCFGLLNSSLPLASFFIPDPP